MNKDLISRLGKLARDPSQTNTFVAGELVTTIEALEQADKRIEGLKKVYEIAEKWTNGELADVDAFDGLETAIAAVKENE